MLEKLRIWWQAGKLLCTLSAALLCVMMPAAGPDAWCPLTSAADPPQKDNGNRIAIPAPDPVKPQVVLSGHHRALCHVGVGDNMPAGSLPDLAGTPRSLADLLGPKLTVVVFWNIDSPYAVEQFRRLDTEVVQSFGDSGVAVVAIHVGQATQEVRNLCAAYGQQFTCLLDRDQTFFHKVGQRRLPRTYLLDSDGTILWFDIEYSRTTRFDLRNAIRWHLQAGG